MKLIELLKLYKTAQPVEVITLDQDNQQQNKLSAVNGIGALLKADKLLSAEVVGLRVEPRQTAENSQTITGELVATIGAVLLIYVKK